MQEEGSKGPFDFKCLLRKSDVLPTETLRLRRHVAARGDMRHVTRDISGHVSSKLTRETDAWQHMSTAIEL